MESETLGDIISQCTYDVYYKYPWSLRIPPPIIDSSLSGDSLLFGSTPAIWAVVNCTGIRGTVCCNDGVPILVETFQPNAVHNHH